MPHHVARLVAIVAALAVSPAFAQTPGVTTTIENDRPAGAAEALSTPEARRAVEPLDWNATRGEGLRTGRDAPETVSPQTLREGGSTAGGGTPDPEADEEAERQFPQEWQGLRQSQATQEGDDESIAGTVDVFTQYCENCDAVNLDYPQKAIGKLFTARGTCSASVVSGNDIIVTAAHCCYDRGNGNWIGGWQFAPAYRDGFAPYGLFDWSSATVLNRWISTGDRQSDVCLIRLRDNSAGRSVTFYTGWLGRSWNWGSNQVHHAVGYPGNLGGGNKKQLCVSESFSPSSGCGGASVLNTGCSMTFGASGGPWIRNYRSGNHVNSVVSGYDGTSCTGSFGRTFNGPRFTSDNIVTLCDILGC